MKLPQKIKIVERKLGRYRALGMTDGKTIQIDPRQSGLGSRERLDSVIHEGLHCCLPEAPEMMIRAYSKRLSCLLWRDSWRRVEK
jgi:hypothetical protein